MGKMTKLEKYWRKQSGIKSTSIKKSKDKTNKKPKSHSQSTTNASKATNSTALKTAVALKKFLQKNDCFDKDLLTVLSNEMDIQTPDDLDKINSNATYDEIVRQVRVLRAKELKEEIYGVDLEEVLTSQGITDPTNDFKTYTQKQWDELYRQCVVERAKELKDQKSKLRLEKKMTKLEKYWRKQSGIK